jgi:molybdate transport system ATP-binding protein
MADVAGTPPPQRIAVRAEDLLLAAEPPGKISAQNVLVGRIVALEPSGAQVYVDLDCGGERWRAKVTQRAVERLALAPGAQAWLILKAHAIIAAT